MLVDRSGRVVYAGPGHGRATDADTRSRPGRPLRDARLRRLPHPPDLRRRPGRRVRPAHGRPPLSPGRDPRHGGRDPGRLAGQTSKPTPAGSIEQALARGTTTIEIKTGYGLTPERRGPPSCGSPARSRPRPPSSGAHLVPPEFAADRGGYLRLLSETMIPAAAGTARWCDVFCEKGAFDVDESRAVLRGGAPARHGAACPRQPAGTGRRGGPGLRARCGIRGSLHPLDAADVDGARRLGPRSPPCSRSATSAPGSRIRTAGPCSTPAPPWRWPATATPVPATPRRCPWPWRWPCGSAG